MKRLSAIAILCAMTCSMASAAHIYWEIGVYGTNRLVIAGAATTAAAFNANYELRLMYLSKSYTYTAGRGYSTFTVMGKATHQSTPGILIGETFITDTVSRNGEKYVMALYEKGTGKYYSISTSEGGSSISIYTLSKLTGDEMMDDLMNPEEYYPVATNATKCFYKGAEIPAFCGWLASQGLTEASLVGKNTNTVNLAFAVNANPTNLSAVAMSITSLSVSNQTLSGSFSLKASDAAGHQSPVSRLNGTAAISLLAATNLTAASSPQAASINLTNGTFQATANITTNDTQFLRLKLGIPAVW